MLHLFIWKSFQLLLCLSSILYGRCFFCNNVTVLFISMNGLNLNNVLNVLFWKSPEYGMNRSQFRWQTNQLVAYKNTNRNIRWRNIDCCCFVFFLLGWFLLLYFSQSKSFVTWYDLFMHVDVNGILFRTFFLFTIKIIGTLRRLHQMGKISEIERHLIVSKFAVRFNWNIKWQMKWCL